MGIIIIPFLQREKQAQNHYYLKVPKLFKCQSKDQNPHLMGPKSSHYTQVALNLLFSETAKVSEDKAVIYRI